MYELTKVYKTSAQAVNAIRMKARNADWKVLDTECAKEHVWPVQGGFAVNNTTLNVAMGFAEAEEERDTGAKESVKAALDEHKGRDDKIPQLPSRPANIKSAADKKGHSAATAKQKAKPADNKSAKDDSADRATRSDVKNGARRPLREGKTLDVWLTTERLQAETGTCPTCKEVHAELVKQHGSFNKTTCSIQFYACRTYNGWDEKTIKK